MKPLLAPVLLVCLVLVAVAASWDSGTVTVTPDPALIYTGQEVTFNIVVSGANDNIINYEIWVEGDQYTHGTLAKRVEGVNDTGFTDAVTHTYTQTSLERNGSEWPHDTTWIKFETTSYGTLWAAYGEFTVHAPSGVNNWRQFANWGRLPVSLFRNHAAAGPTSIHR